MKKYTKRKHIKLFETIYYNADENNFKIGQLPVWIDTYAHWLDKEVNTGLPQYYREFHQGMLVMINFGVRVGSELSGPHFGVVLTHNDDKYHRTLLVAPLTSHGKEYHVDLGTELINRLNVRFEAQSKIVNAELTDLENSLPKVEKKFPETVIMLHSDAIKLLIDYGIDLEFAKNFTIKVGSPNPEIEAFLSNIESIPNYDENSDLNQYINNARELLKESDKLYHQLQTAQRAAHVLQVLADKAKRYSKQTFVDISNINTVSKLRITKFSEFNISENVDVSDEAFALIKEKINNYI